MVSGAVWAGENLSFRLAPYFGGGFNTTKVDNDYYDFDIKMDGFVGGFDLFLERSMPGNPRFFTGADFGFRSMSSPDMEIDGEDVGEPDVNISEVFIGPSFRFFFNENVFFLGTFGLSVLWSSGDDDVVDTTLYGPGFSVGVGYDFPTASSVSFGLFARLIMSVTFGSEESYIYGYYIDSDLTTTFFTPALGASINF